MKNFLKLSLLLMLSMLSIKGLAKVTISQTVLEDGQEYTPDNCSFLESGSLKLNEETNVLLLKNAVLKNTILISTGTNMKIILVGDNVIEPTFGGEYGIRILDPATASKGSITIVGEDFGSNGNSNERATLTIKNKSIGICSYSTPITIQTCGLDIVAEKGIYDPYATNGTEDVV